MHIRSPLVNLSTEGFKQCGNAPQVSLMQTWICADARTSGGMGPLPPVCETLDSLDVAEFDDSERSEVGRRWGGD